MANAHIFDPKTEVSLADRDPAQVSKAIAVPGLAMLAWSYLQLDFAKPSYKAAQTRSYPHGSFTEHF